MTRVITMSKPPVLLALLVLATGGAVAVAEAQELKPGAAVRFQASPAGELDPGWHAGTVYTSPQGCAMVRTPDPKMPRGERILGLLFIQKLERKDGATWVDVPVGPLMSKEPKPCREAVGG
jgi:hypothetical protein